MTSFLNVSLDGKTNYNLVIKHVMFSIFWLIGVLIFVFRIDILILDRKSESLVWLKISLPIIYLGLVVLYFCFLRWYYVIAFLFYPILVMFWFLPKSILKFGKVYLFGSYLSFLFSKILYFKRFVFDLVLFILATIFLITISENWAKWLSVACASYFYISYLFFFIKKSFRKPVLFDAEIEERIKKFISNESPEQSLIVRSYILQEEDMKLQETERREKQIRRTVIANLIIQQLISKLNGHRGRQAYIISWLFEAFLFLLISVFFFCFINYQLFKIDKTNFIYHGNVPLFDFFYYTLKTITFGDIDLVKPASVVARINEIAAFITIGIFILIVVISVFLAMKQDRLKENVKLTTDMFNSESMHLVRYMKDKFGVEMQNAIEEIKNIDDSIKNLRSFIDKLF